ncbi:hypothetical protein [Novosphingopyxis iocasae]|uniref:hypothetical protein n=1 Tax=Novosphingopyxis iocasae TaxID=2762729 RepID=UPI001651A5C8|nr:hypothetical protein [Novosphingopyxis iocasae]
MAFLKSLAGTLIGKKVGEKTAGRGLLGAGVGFLVTKVATRSLPGAALVGGGYLAKKLYDKRKADRRAQAATSTGLSDEDTDMAMARAEGETEIVDGEYSDSAVDDPRDAQQLDPIPPRPVTS